MVTMLAVKETFYHFFVHLQTARLGRCHPIKTGGLPRMDTLEVSGGVQRLQKSGTGMVPGENHPMWLEMKYPANYLC